MKCLRYDNKNTSINAYVLETLIKDEKTKKIILFSSIKDESKLGSNDGPSTNLPLLSALVEYSVVPKDLDISIVFDGCFLTAARQPRYSEVKSILDAAEQSSKVLFSTERIEFTSELSAESAVDEMNKHESLIEFTSLTRNQYFNLLSNVSEKIFEDMR